MECEPKIDPKCRILNAASHLFAKKGFAGVGVREIAKDAQVNISMISYYYKGKNGILMAIIEEYFLKLSKIYEEVQSKQLNPEQSMRLMITKLVKMFRENTEFCKVAITELPYDQPDVMDFKVELLKKNVQLMKEVMPHRSFIKSKNQSSMIGPAFIMMLLSHFLLKDVVTTYNVVELNDEYYEEYINTMFTLFTKGVKGLREENEKQL